MRAIALDIGTTKICAVVVDGETGAVLDVKSVQNSYLPASDKNGRMQDAENIFTIVHGMVQQLQREYKPIGCIGVTGQMHGIVYVDHQGNAQSPLYTWEDKTGDLPCGSGTYAEALQYATGYPLATGYGAVTLYAHIRNNMVPENTEKICTIPDYVSMRLAGVRQPLLHASMAQSLGLFDEETGCFDQVALRRGNLPKELFPKVTHESVMLGQDQNGIPVAVAIGDNQASFAGSVQNAAESICVNIGTGGQVSILSDRRSATACMTQRPYFDGKTLLVGASLCGGSTYAMLEQFFRNVLAMADMKVPSVYPYMDKALAGIIDLPDPLSVNTQFAGTREDVQKRGSIQHISIGNFTPEHLMLGFLKGIARELYDMLPVEVAAKKKKLVAAGNGVRKNGSLQATLRETFGLPLLVPLNVEEAAYGAALFALVGAGAFDTMQQAQKKLVQYQPHLQRA